MAKQEFSHISYQHQLEFHFPNSRTKLQSMGDLKQCLNEKNLFHGTETATVSKFTTQSFLTYFNLV